jgi:nucleotidyltransferase/DNA polymerase involved in DNA repair
MSADPRPPLRDPRSPIPDPLYACLYLPPPAAAASADSTLARIAADFSPRFELHRADLVAIDVSGLERLLGPARTIGAELRRTAAERGVRAHIAIASTRMAGLVLAQARPGLTIVEPGEEAAALAAIDIGILERITDVVGADLRVRRSSVQRAAPASSVQNAARTSSQEIFKRWGVKTLGALAAIPAADLSARLGQTGLVWQAIARGVDVRPLVPLLDDERFESSLELEWPIEGLEPLSFVLTRLLEPLSTRLERRDRGAAVLHLVLRLVTKDRVVRSLQLPAPLRDVRTLRTLALLDLEAHPPGAAIDGVQIVIDPTPGRVLQHTLFTRAQPTVEQLSTLLARLGALMGQDRIGAAALVDTYRPGAFAMRPFKTDHDDQRRKRGDRREISEHSAGSAGSALNVVADHDDQRRDRRDRGDPSYMSAGSASTALNVDSAGSARSALNVVTTVVTALRRCRQPVPARVAADAGRPVRVTTDRMGFAGGAVVACAGPWRTSGDWWAGEAWNRDEWDVALSDGGVYRIFRDRLRDAWFIDAIVD